VEVPPLSTALAGDALRMLAERELSMGLDELALDYAGDVDPAQPRRLLLVAILRKHLDRIERICRAAGLRLAAVTSTALTASRAAGKSAGDGIHLLLTPGSAEVLVVRGGSPAALRHFALMGTGGAGAEAEASPEALARLGNEIHRLVSLMPGGPLAAGGGAELVLLDGLGLGAPAAAALGERIGLPVRGGSAGPPVDPSGELPPADPKTKGSPAAALALAGARPELLAVDFIHSRCAPAKVRRVGRRTMAAAGLALVLGIGILLLFLDLQGREVDLAGLKERIAGLQADVAEAETFLKNNKSLVLGWYDSRPRPLDILKRVTLAFPEEGKVWATSFSATEGLKGSISGKAVDQKSVLAVLDRMKADRAISSVTLSDMREAGGTTALVTFALTFSYRNPE
jgi:hypothetical protein